MLQGFKDALAAADTTEKVVAAMSAFCASRGVDYHAFLEFADSFTDHPTNGNSNYPIEWSERYLRESLYLSDPVIIRAKQHLSSFVWDAENDPTPWYRDALACGIRRGFAVPIHGPFGDFAIVAFASRQPLADFESTRSELCGELHLAATYYKDRLDRLTREPSEFDAIMGTIDTLNEPLFNISD